MLADPRIAAALEHHRAGRIDQAESAYRAILAAEPGNADALHLLGVLLGDRGQHDQAVALIRQAIAASPGAAFFHNSLGNALRDHGQLADAIAAYRQALQLDPHSGQVWSNLGNALRESGDLAGSLNAHRKAIDLLPESAEVFNNLGITYRMLGQLAQAISAFEQAIALQPDYPQALNNLGSARRAAGHVDAALAALLRAVRLKQDSAEIFSNLGNVLKDTGRLDEAIAAQLHAIELNPRYASAHTNLAVALFETGRLDQSLAAHADAIRLMPDEPQLASNRLYTLLFQTAIAPDQLRTEHEAWAQKFADGLPRLSPAAPRRLSAESGRQRLRVAYVSPDFRLHPVGRFMLPLLSHHDKHQFEIFAYSGVRRPDDLTAELQHHCEHWQSVVSLSDAELADRVRRDQIDILIDLTQHMADSRLLVFARKPAPIQMTYLGTLGTTGLTAIDYRLSDYQLDPPGQHDAHYTEKTLRLAGCYWCYPAPPQAPAVNPLPAGPITFGCLNNFCKLSDPCLALWSKILANIPDSRLVLHAHPGVHRQRVHSIFAAAGVAPGRVAFVPMASMADYFSAYQAIHIALDPFPYAGGTTTCDALWMGCPVITLAGQTAIARAGVSILTAAGHGEWIAHSNEEYAAKAITLAADRTFLTTLRQSLRPHLQSSPLCDAPTFARQFERTLLAAL